MAEPKEKPKKGAIKVGQYVWVKDAAIAGSDLFTNARANYISDTYADPFAYKCAQPSICPTHWVQSSAS